MRFFAGLWGLWFAGGITERRLADEADGATGPFKVCPNSFVTFGRFF
jgi:hypothetical protein